MRFNDNNLTLSNTDKDSTIDDIKRINPLHVEHMCITKILYGHIDFTLYTNLKTLDLSHIGGLEVIDLSKCLKLRQIKITRCDVDNIILPKSNITQLNINGSRIILNDDNVLPDTISKLSLVNCNLDSIDVSHITHLYELTLNNNFIRSIDVTNNHNLHMLSISKNRIHGMLNLSENSILNTLHFNDNFIESIWLHPKITLSACSYNDNLIHLTKTNITSQIRKQFEPIAIVISIDKILSD